MDHFEQCGGFEPLRTFETKKKMVRREEACAFALSRIFMYEPRLARVVVNGFGDASTVFSLSSDQLFEALGPYNKYRDAIASTNIERVAEELDGIVRAGYRFMGYDDAAFPEALSECEDAPVGLFVRSGDSLENIFGREKVAFVGTRDASSYGVEWCSRMVSSLAGSDVRPSIVSGLAFGIDIAAHRAAMDAGLPTIAVLGTGIDIIYPRQHEGFAHDIIHRPGSAVISEYPPGVSVLAINFLSRNRIIAGLSRATVLVESRIKGGGMTTARQAASYNREVFALPGRNDDLRSQGCNFLIHSQVADAAISCEELFKSLNYKSLRKTKADRKKECSEFYAGSMDPCRIEWAGRILLAVRAERGLTAAELAGRLAIPFKEVLALVGRLEADGFIEVDLLQRCSIAKNS